MPDVTLAVTYANGTILRAVGSIDLEGWEAQDNKLTVSMHPKDNRWEIFAGSGDIAGTVRKVVINGVTYRVLGDANPSLIPSEYKNEMVVTSGGNMRRMTKQVRTLSAITLACNSTEMETLRAIAEAP